MRLLDGWQNPTDKIQERPIAIAGSPAAARWRILEGHPRGRLCELRVVLSVEGGVEHSLALSQTNGALSLEARCLRYERVGRSKGWRYVLTQLRKKGWAPQPSAAESRSARSLPRDGEGKA